MTTRSDLQAWLLNANIQAFLRVIRAGESSQDDSAYTIVFGGGHFTDFSSKPRDIITKGSLKSSAAGAYQILNKTEDGLLKQYGFTDFSPSQQDERCVALIAGRKAIQDVLDGQLEAAIRKCAYEWASLPFSPYGQPRRSYSQARATFQQYGGIEAAASSVPASVLTGELQSTGEQPMFPLLAALVPSLISAAPDLIRAFGNSANPVVERNAQVAQKVADMAVQVTGAVNLQDATEKIQADPEMAAKWQQAVAQSLDQWVGMATKLAELDEKSRASAKDFIKDYDRSPVVGKFTFVELLSLILVVIAAAGGGYVLYGDFTSEIKGAVITLMLIGGFTGVKEFWLGSSMGSMMKNPPKQPGKE